MNSLSSLTRRVASASTAVPAQRLNYSTSSWSSLLTSRSPRCHSIVRQCRQFNQTSFLRAKTVQEARSRQTRGPLTLSAALLFVLTGGGLYYYFQKEKERLARQKITNKTKGHGKAKVGGSFELIDHNGKSFTSEDMKGKYALVYFGFSNCPDICPDELDKMAEMYEMVKKRVGNALRPIMVTCDPARDSPAILNSYLAEFHPDIIGLTGTYEQIRATCKKYRVYFSTPPDLKPGQDYLVDHSIYFFLMDPEGDFVEAIGRNFTAEQAAILMSNHVKDWKKEIDLS